MVYIYAAAALAIALSSAAATWRVQEWRHASMEAERVEQANELKRLNAKRIDTSAERLEQEKAAVQTEFITIRERVEHVVEKPFYVASELCLDDDGLRELNAARRSAPAASQPAPALPRPAGRHWWDPRAEPEKQD
jgi:hypothetical protein